MKLSVVIVNHNTSDLLKDCLKHLFCALSFARLTQDSQVIVIDNASKDKSIEMLKMNFPSILVIKNRNNLGFAEANNQGIRRSKGDFILLLNTDAFLKKRALVNLLKAITSKENIAATGGKLLNKDGTLQSSVGFFPDILKVFYWMFFLDDLPFISFLLKPYHVSERAFYRNAQQVDWVSGACMLLKKKAIKKAGLMDENIFMYAEEVEWCYRIKKKGFQVLYDPQAEIVHLKGASSKKGSLAGILKEYKGLMYFYRKHKPAWQLGLLKLMLRFGALLRVFVFGIIGRNRPKFAIYEKAFKLAR